MKYLVLLVAILSTLGLSAQNYHRCASTEHQALEGLQTPAYAKAITKTYQQALQQVNANAFKSMDEEVLRIPVVVHVIYNNEAQNLSDEVIARQLEILNRDYRRQNEDADLTRDEFVDVAGDTFIEFYFAEHDPDGNPTTGITRTETEVSSFLDAGGDIFGTLLGALDDCGVAITDVLAGNLTDEQTLCLTVALADVLGSDLDLDVMKFAASGGVDAWDTEQYLNIWVCNLAIDILGTETPSILGFATPPAAAPNWPDGSAGTQETDGVVLHYQMVADNNPTLTEDLAVSVGLGRTAVHEVGHYLGLRHIWGDGDCTADDGLEDTPPAAAASQQTCDLAANSCVDDGPVDLPDMIENFMDYSNENCMNMFTNGQIEIMRAMLTGPRAGLLSTNVGIDEPTWAQYISLSPNPTIHDITIRLDLPNAQSAMLSVFDTAGKMITQQAINTTQTTLDLGQFGKGLYLVQVTIGGEQMVEKVLVQ